MNRRDRKRTVKRFAIAATALLLLPMLAWLAALYPHHRPAEPVSRAELEAAYERNVAWLQRHRAEIVDQQNPTLWWLLLRTAELRQDLRLRALVREHLARHWGGHSLHSPWRPLFQPTAVPIVSLPQVSALPDYNQLFIYGLSCDRALGAEPVVRRQLEAGFCPRHHPFSPACATHQLMGVNFALASRCGDAGELQALARALQADIRTQLALDPRLVDVFLQRLMLLSEAGQARSLKPAWIRRALQAQRPDGGWGAMQPLLPLGGGHYLGFGAKGLAIGIPSSNFHASAQGLRLTALLLNAHPTGRSP